MSFFKHLLRGWMGGGYAGHHGRRRYGGVVGRGVYWMTTIEQSGRL